MLVIALKAEDRALAVVTPAYATVPDAAYVPRDSSSRSEPPLQPRSVKNSNTGNFIKSYKGFQIYNHEDGVSVSGSIFAHIDDAEEYLDRMDLIV